MLLFTTRFLSCAEKNMLDTSFTSQTFAQDRHNTLLTLGNFPPAWCIQSLCSISREHREKKQVLEKAGFNSHFKHTCVTIKHTCITYIRYSIDTAAQIGKIDLSRGSFQIYFIKAVGLNLLHSALFKRSVSSIHPVFQF